MSAGIADPIEYFGQGARLEDNFRGVTLGAMYWDLAQGFFFRFGRSVTHWPIVFMACNAQGTPTFMILTSRPSVKFEVTLSTPVACSGPM
jgi:hypothetical protein